MKNTFSNYSRAGIFIILTALPTTALWARDGCTLYEHIDYGGGSFHLNPDESLTYVGDDWNDMISSMEVGPGCDLRVWQHANFEGDVRTFDDDSNWVGDLWNDQISSLSCSCD